MKTIKHLFTLLLLLCATEATAHGFEVDGVYYNILSGEDKTVEVTYRGTSYGQYANEYYDNVVIPESVVYNGTTYGVTSIGSSAFYGCPDLTSIEIPSCVTSIGNQAFYNCSGLTSIEIPNSVTSIGNSAFYNCSGLASVEMPDSITKVGENAFTGTAWYNNQPNGVVYIGKVLYKYKGTMPANASVTIKDGTLNVGVRAFSSCKSLTSIEIPNSVTSIGNYAFQNCTQLANIAIPSSIASVGVDAFTGTAWYDNQPDGVVYIGKVLYKYKGKMPANTEITVKDSTLNIAYGAFKDCSRLKSIEIPNSVTTIEDYAFKGCYELESIVIPNSVTSIGTYAFNGCAGLTSVVIGNGVTSIGSYAFEGCTGLETVINLSNLTFNKGSSGYGYVAYYANKVVNAPNGCVDGDYVWHENEDGMILASYLGAVAELTLPAEYNGKSVTSIGDYAFYGCTALESIVIPNSVTSIGNYAFNGCTSLKDLRIEAGKDSLSLGYHAYNSSSGKGLFYDCPLETLYLGRDLSYNTNYKYGYSPFYNKSTLISVTIGDGVTNIGEYAFYGCSGLTSIVIPDNVTSVGERAFYGCSGLASIVIGNGVTSIGDYAANGCSGLTSIEIPNSVTSVGSYAFNGCTSLKDLRIEAGKDSLSFGNYVFSSCPLEILYLGRDLSYNNNKYGYSPFYNKSTLASVVISDSVTSLGNNAFYGCSALASIDIPNGVANIGECTFYGCTGLTSVEIPNSVISIGSSAFGSCSGITNVEFNAENCTSMGISFSYCTALSTVAIGENVKNIPSFAFYGCKGLTNLVIPNSVTSIGTYAFYGCSGLADVLIGNSVTSIGEAAFSGCTGLTSVINFSNLTFSKGSIAYGSVAYDADIVINAPNGYIDGGYVWFENEDGMTLASCLGAVAELTLPAEYNGKSVTSIGDYAFYGCTALESIVIPNSVTSIGNYAFNGCTSLKDLRIEAGKDSLSLGYKNYAHSSGKGLFCDCPLESLYLGRDLSYNTSSSYGYSPFYNKSTLASVTISDSVTNIGEYAFCGCKGLTSIVIPNSVTSIGYEAFRGCTGLTSITIPNSVTSIGGSAFENCAGIASVIIGNGVTDIKFRTFFGCSGLTSVVFGNSVVDINGAAFEYCRIRTIINLSSLTFRKGSIAYGYVAYDADVVINAPNGYIVGDYVWSEVDGENILAGYVGDAADLTLPANCNGENYAVGESVFYANTTITNIVMPDNVTRIGDSAFYGCTNLASIEISNSVTSIGEFAFRGCTSLTNIVLPNSVTNVGMYAFYECSGLTNVVISDSVTRIEEGLFCGCSALTSIEIPNSVTGIRFYAFQYCTGLTSVVIGNGVTDIEFNAFSGCSNLANVIIGDNVKYIGSKAFEGCTALNSIVFPDNLADINEQAFYKCSGLTNIVIGNGVRYIDSSAFFGCSSLKTVINCSKLTFSKGATDYGYVAYYADKVINAPNGYVDGDYVWAVVNEENTLCGYIGNEKELVLPGSCNGEDYAIGNSAFYNCTGLTSIEIPSVITDIKDDAFYGCTGLKEVHISDLTAWCKIYFSNIYANPLYYANNLYLNGELVADVVVPDVLPEVNEYAFINCTGLTNVVVSDGVDVIGESAFSGCSNIETLYISNSIYSIGDNAFAGCNKIYDIKVGAKKPIGGNLNIFANAVYDNATLYIPNGTKSLYDKREPWNRFFYIKEMDFTAIDEVFDDVKGENGTNGRRPEGLKANRKGICYDLNGRVVENPSSGIYIINGKKVLVK